MAKEHKGYFEVACCKKRRGILKGVLVCSVCDYDHDRATSIPNENLARDVPAGLWYVYPPRSDDA